MFCLAEEMATAADLTRTVDRLEVHVNNHITFGKWIGGALIAWLLAGTGLLIKIEIDIGTLAAPQKLVHAATNPDNPKSQSEVQKLIVAANKSGVPLPQSIVSEAGQKFTNASARAPKAWDAAVTLASYRTTFNSDLLEVGTAQQLATTPGFKESGPSARFFNAPPRYPSPAITYGGNRPPDQGALMGLLDPSNPLNLGQAPPWVGTQPEVILVEGGALLLDGMVLRHVVIRETNVFYNGGLTKLEDVIFVDCTFTLKNEPSARLFALAVLGQSQVVFPARLKQ